MGVIMKNAVLILILSGIAAAIVFYLIRAKKSGRKCIGCPYSKGCGGNCGGDHPHAN